MTRRGIAVVLGLIAALALLTGGGPAAAAGPTSTAASPLPTLAYYYIWYDRSSWNRAKIDYPSLGRYSSDDAEVMRQQVKMAKGAGITGFVVSWKSSPTNDRRLRTLIDVARSEDFRLAIIYEALDFTRNPLPVDQIAADFAELAASFVSDPVFGVFDKPLVIWSGSWMFSPQDVARVVAPYRDKLLVLASERSVADYERLADVVAGDAYYWSSVDPQRDVGFAAKLAAMGAAVHRHHGLWVAPFAPGFDARQIGGTRVVERRDGATLREEYAGALASSPDALGLISWNEFSENSYVEPSRAYGNRYLAVLRQLLMAPAPSLGPLAEDSSGSSGSLVSPRGVVVGGLAAVLVVAGAAVLLRRRRRSRRQLLLALVAVVAVTGVTAALVVRTSQAETSPGRAPPAGAASQFFLGAKPVRSADAVTVGAVGDIACPPDAAGLGEDEVGQLRPCRQQVTADLMRAVAPDAVLVLGDNQYPNGSVARYQGGYDRTWGQFKSITYPVPGNHEYGSPGAQGYFGYFGAAAGPSGLGFYSHDLAGWHLIALNAECDHVGGCGSGSPEERWLAADLATHPAACTLAYWHQPRFSSGTHGSDPTYDAFWRDLYAAGAEIVLNGHDHDYERLAPLTPDGTADPARGIREFVVGTGGDSHYRFHTITQGSEVRIAESFGVLKLTLRPGSYDWRFVSEPGALAADSGTGTCH